jgi:hypothetical protein
MFHILLGDAPVLHPHVRLYQRLLAGDATEATFVAEETQEADPPPGHGLRSACVGGRWDIDDASAAMLAQVIGMTGAETQAHDAADLAPARLTTLGLQETDCLVLCLLDPSPSRASLLQVRRLKRLAPDLRVGVAGRKPARKAA